MKPLTKTDLERKSTRLELKSLDETGTFEGYASVFNVEDQGQDIVAPGAFKNSLAQRGIQGIKLLHEHSCYDPIGMWLDLAEDAHGLRARGKLLIDDLPKAREVYALLKNKVLDGLSIGFRTVKSSTARGSDAVRILEEVDLREISTVIFPMNEEAVISAVKSTDDLPSEIAFIREFERRLLSDSELSRSKVAGVISCYKSLSKALSDSGGEQVAEAVRVKQPDVAWSSAFADELRRLTDAARS